MKHRVGYNRLGRKAAHRISLHRNMATSLLRHERIKTTKAKALAVRRTAEKMITRAKEDSVHNRRMIGRDIKDKEVLAKLFLEIGPRYKSRPGGYTRILKLGHRKGDAAEMVLLELVGEEETTEKKKKPSKKAEPVKDRETAPTKAAKETEKGEEHKKAEEPKEEPLAAEKVEEEKQDTGQEQAEISEDKPEEDADAKEENPGETSEAAEEEKEEEGK
ncbi:MAG: 50S ribosomal protein L17 [Spirochaetaceae bacterium]